MSILTCSSIRCIREINSVVIDTNFLSTEADWRFVDDNGVVNERNSLPDSVVSADTVARLQEKTDFSQQKMAAVLKAYILFSPHLLLYLSSSSLISCCATPSKTLVADRTRQDTKSGAIRSRFVSINWSVT